MTCIRKVGGSMAVVIPPHVLKQLDLGVGSRLSLEVHDKTLHLRSVAPQYTLEELLAQSDYSAVPHDDWVSDTAVGQELL